MFKNLYLISLECINAGNSFGLNIGDVVYAAGWDGSDFARDINNASLSTDIEYTKQVAKRIYNEGDFIPTIKEVVRSIGNSVNFD
jgi:hypothetical protein